MVLEVAGSNPVSRAKNKKMCDKAGFETKQEAASALRLIKKTSKRSQIPRRYYWCKECKRYVLTSRKFIKQRNHHGK